MAGEPGNELAAWKAPARALRRRSVTVDRAAEFAETARRLIRNEPVIVFSMGKAGTTALEAAIRDSGRDVIKAHSLTAKGMAQRFENAERRPRFLWRTQVLRYDLRLRSRHRRTIISAVRDPVARAVSAYFYGEALAGDASHSVSLESDGGNVCRYLKGMSIGHDWFVDELLPVTGIDVYQDGFPSRVGFRVYERGPFRLLLVRQEDLRRVGAEALGALLGPEATFSLPERNSADTNTSANRYRRFVENYAFDRSLLEEVYAQPLAQHFYTENERHEFIMSWSRASPSPEVDDSSHRS